MNLATTALLLGLLLILANDALRRTPPKVVVKYLPREMDAWFKDPENQPMYLFNDMFQGDNIRTL